MRSVNAPVKNHPVAHLILPEQQNFRRYPGGRSFRFCRAAGCGWFYYQPEISPPPSSFI
jgi:hypothetical protein